MNILIVSLFTIILVSKGFSKQEITLPCLKELRTKSLNSKSTYRIVGGTDSNPNETPYIASLRRRGGHFCGATVLNENWLLTAGHCVCNGLNKIMKPTQINAILGLHQFSTYKNIEDTDNNVNVDQPYNVNIQQIIVHSKYVCTKPDNDIALLKLTKSIQYNDFVKPTCIAISDKNNDTSINNSYEGEKAIVSGWGWTHENQDIGKRPDILQKAKIDVWTNDQCQRSFQNKRLPHKILPTQLCAGYENGGIDSCWADSGGPLVTEDDNILIGVVSTGVGCGRPGLPGIYTRVSQYVDWINNVIISNTN